jgi:hypothetical protein
MGGYKRYANMEAEEYVFEFMMTYARRIRSDKEWTKILKKNPEMPFLCFITPKVISHLCKY